MRAFATLESPSFYRAFAMVVFAFALSCWTLALHAYASGASTFSWGWLVLGVCSVAFGLIFPVRIVWIGAILPIEIARNVRILAVTMPVGGIGLCIASIGWSATTAAIGFVLAGACAAWAALMGFWQLSRSLPKTFYMGEMASIFLSTGVWGNKEESNADRSFKQWTKGRSEGVSEGQPAPDGTLVTLDGHTKKLSEYSNKDSLLVLNFGSYSCPHHRKRLEELTEVMERWEPYGVRFLTIYTAEAHPEDGWRLENQYLYDAEFTGNPDDFCFHYAKTIDERRNMAHWLIDKKSFGMELVLDQIDDNLLFAYNSWPIRLYIIDDGTVVFCGKQGPFGYAPSELDDALARLMKVSGEEVG